MSPNIEKMTTFTDVPLAFLEHFAKKIPTKSWAKLCILGLFII
jgi:hypothetical protein